MRQHKKHKKHKETQHSCRVSLDFLGFPWSLLFLGFPGFAFFDVSGSGCVFVLCDLPQKKIGRL